MFPDDIVRLRLIGGLSADESDAEASVADLETTSAPADEESVPETPGIRFLPIDTRGLRLRHVGWGIYRYKRNAYLVGRREKGGLAWMTFPSFDQALSWRDRGEDEMDH